jgi:hypothetical protein
MSIVCIYLALQNETMCCAVLRWGLQTAGNCTSHAAHLHLSCSCFAPYVVQNMDLAV